MMFCKWCGLPIDYYSPAHPGYCSAECDDKHGVNKPRKSTVRANQQPQKTDGE